MSLFQLNPEACHVYNEAGECYRQELDLQMCGQDFEEQLNFSLDDSADEQEFHDGLLLLLLLATGGCNYYFLNIFELVIKLLKIRHAENFLNT